jgi:ubiquinone/menaquinone biosynthesis C-methylase UbiE
LDTRGLITCPRKPGAVYELTALPIITGRGANAGLKCDEKRGIFSPMHSPWNDTDVVESYARKTSLQPAEQTILDILKRGHLSEQSMLDIGVGAGRTTPHFAALFKEYVGIDYAPNMIEACKKRFLDQYANTSFLVGDARSMPSFQDRTFDLILFSYNGIDYICHQDRLAALKEIHRVGKPGGRFCFSTHNLKSANKVFRPKQPRTLSLRKTARRLARRFLITFIYNRYSELKNLGQVEHAMINDGGYSYRFKTYYIRPAYQLEQLGAYFDHVRVFSRTSGNEITNLAELDCNDDEWLYYLCTIKGGA